MLAKGLGLFNTVQTNDCALCFVICIRESVHSAVLTDAFSPVWDQLSAVCGLCFYQRIEIDFYRETVSRKIVWADCDTN